jgi:hypothetical protein
MKTCFLAGVLLVFGCDSTPLPVGDPAANGGEAGAIGSGPGGTAGPASTSGSTSQAGTSGSTGQAGAAGAAGAGQPDPVTTVVEASTCPALPDSIQSSAGDVATPPTGCFCTRRPGPYNSYTCPMGAGESAAQVIGPEGGQISLLGQQGKASGVPFQIVFPPGAVAAATTIRVTETQVSPPDGYVDHSPVYLIEPRGLKLARIAALQVPFSVASGVPFAQKDFAVFERAETGACAFARIADSYTNAGFEMSSLTELRYLFVGSVKTAAQQGCP